MKYLLLLLVCVLVGCSDKAVQENILEEQIPIFSTPYEAKMESVPIRGGLGSGVG